MLRMVSTRVFRTSQCTGRARMLSIESLPCDGSGYVEEYANMARVCPQCDGIGVVFIRLH